MAAALILEAKRVYDDGAILEMRVWRLPGPLAGSEHPFKYRLFYGYPGRRIVGYDNERGKGDHRHLGKRQEQYVFVSAEQLIDDFLADVVQARKR